MAKLDSYAPCNSFIRNILQFSSFRINILQGTPGTRFAFFVAKSHALKILPLTDLLSRFC